jgi:hypothetical protein
VLCLAAQRHGWPIVQSVPVHHHPWACYGLPVVELVHCHAFTSRCLTPTRRDFPPIIETQSLTDGFLVPSMPVRKSPKASKTKELPLAIF